LSRCETFITKTHSSSHGLGSYPPISLRFFWAVSFPFVPDNFILVLFQSPLSRLQWHRLIFSVWSSAVWRRRIQAFSLPAALGTTFPQKVPVRGLCPSSYVNLLSAGAPLMCRVGHLRSIHARVNGNSPLFFSDLLRFLSDAPPFLLKQRSTMCYRRHLPRQFSSNENWTVPCGCRLRSTNRLSSLSALCLFSRRLTSPFPRQDSFFAGGTAAEALVFVSFERLFPLPRTFGRVRPRAVFLTINPPQLLIGTNLRFSSPFFSVFSGGGR